MRGKQNLGWAVLVLLMPLVPGTARAGPYLGEWGYCWHSAPDCPHGEYCFLHYWIPDLYRVKYCVHPAHLDQYPPAVPVPTISQWYAFPCRLTPPAPTPVYADPAAYYGRPLVPPEEEAKEKKEDARDKP
jgi:hypothetical protein